MLWSIYCYFYGKCTFFFHSFVELVQAFQLEKAMSLSWIRHCEGMEKRKLHFLCVSGVNINFNKDDFCQVYRVYIEREWHKYDFEIFNSIVIFLRYLPIIYCLPFFFIHIVQLIHHFHFKGNSLSGVNLEFCIGRILV